MPPTGPRTPEGKQVSSKNAISHGLFAAELLMTNEKPEDLAQYRDAFWAVLQLAPKRTYRRVRAQSGTTSSTTRAP